MEAEQGRIRLYPGEPTTQNEPDNFRDTGGPVSID